MMLKSLLKKILYGAKRDSESYIKHLRSKGMVIGKNCYIYAPTRCVVDETRPWMIEIGDNVSITEGVTILTHGYDWIVSKGLYGNVMGSAGRVRIGSNVFIGMNSTILKGVTIGDGVVIGAGSLISRDVPPHSVVVGNPQRVVCTVEEYVEKRRQAQLDEAYDLYRCWMRNSPDAKACCTPPRDVFREFFWLFEDRGTARTGFSDPSFEWTMQLRGTYDKSVKRFTSTEPAFEDYESFLAYMQDKMSLESDSDRLN